MNYYFNNITNNFDTGTEPPKSIAIIVDIESYDNDGSWDSDFDFLQDTFDSIKVLNDMTEEIECVWSSESLDYEQLKTHLLSLGLTENIELQME